MYIQNGWEWFKVRAESTHSRAWLALISFTESCIFVIPPDPLLALIILAGSPRWIYWTLITLTASIAGATFGYFLGAFFFDIAGTPIISFYGLEEEVALVRGYFDEGTFITIFLSALTPIPFKVFVLTAGFLKANFFVFILASILGRALRYGLIAYATHRFGKQALMLFAKYTTLTTLVAILILAAYFAYIVIV